jgi:hypothetical protein
MSVPNELIAKRPLIATIADQLLSLRELRVLIGSAERVTLRVWK